IVISLIMILLTSAITAIRYRMINPLSFIKVISTGKKALLSRRISMVIQYAVTIALIIVSLFFIRQLNFMLNRDMGFRQNNIITIPFFTRVDMSSLWAGSEDDKKKAMADYKLKRNKEQSNQQFVIDEIKKNPYLTNLCFGHSPLTNSKMPVKNMNSSQDFQDASIMGVTPVYKDLYGLKMAEGRFFESEKDQSRGDKIVINQKAKQYLGIDDFTKCQIANRYWGSNKIIGIVEDFATDHLSKDIQPLVLYYFDDKTDNDLMVEITKGKEAESIEFLGALYNKVNLGMTFTYQFVKDDVANLYTEDKKLVLVYSLFTIIALIITSLGLFSFSIYDIQQRFKEIGIRKANGSGTWETVFYLTQSVLVLLGIAFVVAVPVAWYGILKYLEGFANKAPVSWWMFVLAGLFTLLISILTLIWQSYRAASRNPVDALRYE
ncbi:MAG: FtsX-like permease family protein, partial [Bacteroidales bacterium]